MFIKRRTVTFSALICACAIFALVPSGAFAAGTTAFSCSPEQGAKDFSDAHCNNAVTAGTGKFGHVRIEGENQEFTVTNANTASETTAATPIGLLATFSGVPFEAVCNTATGKGKISNGEAAGTMKATGTITMEFSACSVPKPASGKCSVAEPIVYKGEFKTFQSETKMGVEFLPLPGENFGKFTIKDHGAEHCPFDGTYEIEGSFEGTPGSSPLGTRGHNWILRRNVQPEMERHQIHAHRVGHNKNQIGERDLLHNIGCPGTSAGGARPRVPIKARDPLRWALLGSNQ